MKNVIEYAWHGACSFLVNSHSRDEWVGRWLLGWALNTKEDRPARLHERKASLLWVRPFMTVERKWVFALRDVRSHDGFVVCAFRRYPWLLRQGWVRRVSVSKSTPSTL